MRVASTMREFWRESERIKLNNQNNLENFNCETSSLQIIKMIVLITNEENYLLEKASDIYNLETRKDSTLLDSRAYFCQKVLMSERCRALSSVVERLCVERLTSLAKSIMIVNAWLDFDRNTNISSTYKTMMIWVS